MLCFEILRFLERWLLVLLPVWLRLRARNAQAHVRRALRGWVHNWFKIKYQISAILGREADLQCLLATLLSCDCSGALNKTDLKPCCKEFYVPNAEQWDRSCGVQGWGEPPQQLVPGRGAVGQEHQLLSFISFPVAAERSVHVCCGAALLAGLAPRSSWV